MKHVAKLLLTLLIIHFISIPKSYSQNMIPNGDFESGLASWWTNASGDGNASFTIISDDVQEGSQALMVDVVAPGVNPWDVQAVNNAWDSESGKSYTLKFWAKAATAGSSFKVIMQLDPAYAEQVYTLSDSWEEYEWTFNAQANGLQLKFHFPNSGTFFIDGISIPEEEEAVELVLNGSFELGTGNNFTNWWLGTGNGEGSFTEETSDVLDGSRSLKVEVTALGSNPWDIQAINDAWPSLAGEDYTVSFWAKGSSQDMTLKAVLQIGGSYSEQTYILTEDWAKYEWHFTAGANDLQFKFQFTSVGTYLVDHVSIPYIQGQPQPGSEDIVLVEAESGTPVEASDPPVFLTLQEGDVEFIRVQEDFAATSNPGTETRMLTYNITFPAAGTYDLYVRMRVGAGGFNDDSFYYGNGFGEKSASDADQWITVNGLSPVGYDEPHQIVAEAGTAGNQIWKWLKLSSFSGQGETGPQFEVPEGALTQSFQIGSRENGLDIDKFAFGLAGMLFTVDNLDKGESGSTVPPPPPYTPTGPPIAQGHPKFLGNVYSNPQLSHFTNYWNQVTPENAGKWASVEGTRDVMNWNELDASYALAKENGFPFRFHVLIWGNQQPTWIESLPAEEQLEEIKEWFEAVANRYPDIDFLEVVNEPLHDPPAGVGNGNYIDALGGSGETGWDWILNSFRLAKQYFPDSKLMINEYSITNNGRDAQRYLDIVKLLQEEDLIDVIGVQGHAFSTRVPAAITKQNLDLLATSGLPIMVTEFDIDGTNDQAQLEEYQRVFPVFWEHPAVMGVTLWGWRPGMWRTPQGAYLVLDNGAERPSIVWLRQYVESTKPETPQQGITKFVLINAETNEELFELEDGVVLDLEALGTKEINIVAQTDSDEIKSILFNLSGTQIYNHIENVAPYALFANDGNDYNSWLPAPGPYQLGARSFSEIRARGEEISSLSISFTIAGGEELPVVEKLTLYNAATDVELFELEEGAVINLQDIGTSEINIRAYTDPTITGSVRFNLSGAESRTQIENVEPYALFQNDGDDFFSWTPSSGNYTLSVTPFTKSSGRGEAGEPWVVNFTIETEGGENLRTISAYPNPGTNLINIPLEGNYRNISISMVDLTGREVINKKVQQTHGGNYVLDVSGLEVNIYLIKVISDDGIRNIRWVKK